MYEKLDFGNMSQILDNLLIKWTYESKKRRFDCITKKEVIEHIKPLVKIDRNKMLYIMPEEIYNEWIGTIENIYNGIEIPYYKTHIGNYKIKITYE